MSFLRSCLKNRNKNNGCLKLWGIKLSNIHIDLTINEMLTAIHCSQPPASLLLHLGPHKMRIT